ncbi:hypothetical protein [Candidatus Bartonella washoeensis]|uniref:hypothetical protein n=1 Tax=Candidatus Bartonella washoeensis TaxID=186739 RepID=UPI000319ADF8|nr:hypothetical protein [Bartonella washoeensis]
MNPLVFILLVVSCTDDFNSCYSNKTMAKTYPTAQACEQAMVPSTKKFTSYGQQIFAQCTKVHANLQQQKINVIWTVTNRGNFLLKSQNINDKVSASHESDILPASFPALCPPPINLLHKKP